MAKYSSVTISNEMRNHLKAMAIAAIKRTAPHNGTLPVTYNKLLQGAIIKCKGKTTRVQSATISGFLADYLKSSEHSKVDLAKLTATPFPFLDGKYKEKEDDNDYQPEPLYNPDSGTIVASRYSGFALTKLGRYLADRFADVSMENFKGHQCIIPVILLKPMMPWCPGHRSEMLPYNPRELFELQKRMLKIGSKEISDRDVQEVFKGPDLGDNYTIYQTDESLAAQFAAGSGSVTVVPDILLDRQNKFIIFVHPPYSSTSDVLVEYLVRRIKKKGQYKTFNIKNFEKDIAVSGNRCIIQNVEFIGSDAEIRKELRKDHNICKQIRMNIVSLETEGEDVNRIIYTKDDEDILDFKMYPRSIKDILWRCIMWEYNLKYDAFEKEANEIRQRLWFYFIMEKISREGVVDVINAANVAKNERGRNIAKDTIYAKWGVEVNRTPSEIAKLIEEGQLDPDDPLKEGLTYEELDVVYNKKSQFGGYNTLVWMTDRDDILSVLGKDKKRLDELEYYLSTPQAIYDYIYGELDVWTRDEEFARKSTAYFVRNYLSRNYKIALPSLPAYDKQCLPCTIYYNYISLVRCFGKNINLPLDLKNPENVPYYPFNSLNCLTTDQLYVFSNSKMYQLKATDIATTYTQNIILHGILPYNPSKRMLVFTSKLDDLGGGVINWYDSKYIVINKGGITEPILFEPDEFITSWCYLPDKEDCYINMRVWEAQTKMQQEIKQGIVQIPFDTFPKYEYCKPVALSYIYGMVADCYAQEYSPNNEVQLVIPSTDSFKLQANFKKDYGKVVHPITTEILYFAQNFDIYYDTVYIPWLDKTPFVLHSKVPRNKKSVLKEYVFLHEKDSCSQDIYAKLFENLEQRPKNHFYVTHKFESEGYQNYDISQLEDWTLIDFRYKMPKVRPKDEEEFLKACIEQMNIFFTKTRDFKPRHLNIVKEYIRKSTISAEYSYLLSDDKDNLIDKLEKDIEGGVTSIDNTGDLTAAQKARYKEDFSAFLDGTDVHLLEEDFDITDVGDSDSDEDDDPDLDIDNIKGAMENIDEDEDTGNLPVD